MFTCRILSVAWLLVWTAEFAFSGEKTMLTRHKDPPEIIVTARAKVEGDRSVVAFYFENRSPHAIFIFDRAYRVVNGVLIDQPAMVTMVPSQRLVDCSLYPPDPHKSYAAPPTAFGTKVSPGQTYRGSCAVPDQGTLGKNWQIRLGYVVASAAFAQKPLPSKNNVVELPASEARNQQFVVARIDPLERK